MFFAFSPTAENNKQDMQLRFIQR